MSEHFGQIYISHYKCENNYYFKRL